MSAPWSRRPTWCQLCLWVSLLVSALFCCAIWLGMNSDRDNIPSILTQVIPAGHATCQTSTNFMCDSCLENRTSEIFQHSTKAWEFQYSRDGKDLSLSSQQCQAAFPGLFEDIWRGTSHWQKEGNISFGKVDAIRLRNGLARVAIIEGELHVISARAKGEDHRRKILAILSSIYRAVTTEPERTRTPNIEFVFSVEDKISDIARSTDPVWTLARKAAEEAAWLMPDFGLWAWENAHNSIGPYTEVVEKIVDLEKDSFHWFKKKEQMVWRGKLSFAPKLRRVLMQVARGKEWADVKPLDWTRKNNFLTMEDHCQYMFIAHVEGRSSSASLKYRQACRSVVVAHKLQYIQHHHYLMVNSGPHQNFVEVERDFSDLTEKLEALLADPNAAKRIADNNVKTFRERYLTPAASVCYWRALFEGYAAVAFDAKLLRNGDKLAAGKSRGMRYESFVLLDDKSQMAFEG